MMPQQVFIILKSIFLLNIVLTRAVKISNPARPDLIHHGLTT